MNPQNNEVQEAMIEKKHSVIIHPIDSKIQHPPSVFTVNQTYMIRKQSLSHSNDQIVRRLNRCFQRIKKLKAHDRQKQLVAEYEPDNCDIRRDFRKFNELYNQGSKIRQIRDKKIEKMKTRIQKAKKQVNKDEMILTREVDVNKLYLKQYKTGGSSAQKPT